MSDVSGDGFGDALVVDASVAAKWYLKEEGHERATLIMEAGLSRETKLIASGLLVAEIGNVLWQRERRGEMIGDEVREVWAAFGVAPVDFFDIGDTWCACRTKRAARSSGRTVRWKRRRRSSRPSR